MKVNDVHMRSREVIEILIDRDGLVCRIGFCKDPTRFTNKNPPTIDHILPKSHGGEDVFENFQIACQNCNSKRGNRKYLEDGSLEPLPSKNKPAKVVKKTPCETCYEGRLLLEDETCPTCNSGPQPKNFPKYRQKVPKECDHDEFFCWSCNLGFVERRSAINSIIVGP